MVGLLRNIWLLALLSACVGEIAGDERAPEMDAAVPDGAPPSVEAPLRIAVISDLNGDYGSTEYRWPVANAVTRIIDLGPDLVLTTGDMVAGEKTGLDYAAMWSAFHAAVTDRLEDAGLPFAVTPGNHDASGYAAFAGERALFASEWNARRAHAERVVERVARVVDHLDRRPARVPLAGEEGALAGERRVPGGVVVPRRDRERQPGVLEAIGDRGVERAPHRGVVEPGLLARHHVAGGEDQVGAEIDDARDRVGHRPAVLRRAVVAVEIRDDRDAQRCLGRRRAIRSRRGGVDVGRALVAGDLADASGGEQQKPDRLSLQ